MKFLDDMQAIACVNNILPDALSIKIGIFDLDPDPDIHTFCEQGARKSI